MVLVYCDMCGVRVGGDVNSAAEQRLHTVAWVVDGHRWNTWELCEACRRQVCEAIQHALVAITLRPRVPAYLMPGVGAGETARAGGPVASREAQENAESGGPAPVAPLN